MLVCICLCLFASALLYAYARALVHPSMVRFCLDGFLTATLLFCQYTALPPGSEVAPDNKRFFCKWKDDCPPCEDSIRGVQPGPASDDDWDMQDPDGDGTGFCCPDDLDLFYYYSS